MVKDYDQDAALDAEYRRRSKPTQRHTWKTRSTASVGRMRYLRGSWNRLEVARPITLPDRPAWPLRLPVAPADASDESRPHDRVSSSGASVRAS